ncbi:unnamed protein product [Pedinophyceae sp. YPF-701]|nr:unnamed protein product [Pedinophyceae sp. YPF-701]
MAGPIHRCGGVRPQRTPAHLCGAAPPPPARSCRPGPRPSSALDDALTLHSSPFGRRAACGRRKPSSDRRVALAARGGGAGAEDAPTPLSSVDLEEWLSSSDVEGSILSEEECEEECLALQAAATSSDYGAGTEAPKPGAHVKTLVLRVGPKRSQRYVAAVIGLHDRLDTKKIAALTGVSKSRVEFAKADVAERLTGFVPGTIPPLGHREKIPVFLDAQVAAAGVLYGGGGTPGIGVRVSPDALVSAADATVADIAAHAAPAPSAPDLPEPWEDGVELAAVTGIVATARRLARTLVFFNIVPADVEVPDAPSQFVRTRWACPGAPGEAVALQVVAGASLEKSLGEDATAELLSQVRVGATVEVAGRPQGKEQDRPVLDLVATSVRVLRRSPYAPRNKRADAGRGAGPADARVHSNANDGSWADAYAIVPTQPAAPVSLEGIAGHSGGPRVVVVDTIDMVLEMFARLQEAAAAAAERGSPMVVGVDAEWQPYARGVPRTPVSLFQISLPDVAFVVDLLSLCQPPGAVLHGPSHADVPPTDPIAPATPNLLRAAADGRVTASGLSVAESALSAAIEWVFASDAVIKVGFQLDNDLRRIHQSYPHLPCVGGSGRAVEPLDVSPSGNGASAALVRTAGPAGPSEAPRPLRAHVDAAAAARIAFPQQVEGLYRLGLARLCTMVLGEALDKSQQTSQWAQRPLTPAQLAYAAADAHVLTRIFARLADVEPKLLDRAHHVEASLGLTDVSTFAGDGSSWPRKAVEWGRLGGLHGSFAVVPQDEDAEVKAGEFGRPAEPLMPGPERPVGRSQRHFSRRRRRPSRGGDWAAERGVKSVRDLDVDLEKACGELLGRAVGATRLEVVHSLVRDDDGSLDARSGDKKRYVRFPRGGGAVLWQNAVVLLINVDGGGKYPNTFRETPDGRTTVTWYPSATREMRSTTFGGLSPSETRARWRKQLRRPEVAAALALSGHAEPGSATACSNAGAHVPAGPVPVEDIVEAAAAAQASGGSVLLVCRRGGVPKPADDRYVCMGRAVCCAVRDASAGSPGHLELVFELPDWADAVREPAGQAVVQGAVRGATEAV